MCTQGIGDPQLDFYNTLQRHGAQLLVRLQQQRYVRQPKVCGDNTLEREQLLLGQGVGSSLRWCVSTANGHKAFTRGRVQKDSRSLPCRKQRTTNGMMHTHTRGKPPPAKLLLGLDGAVRRSQPLAITWTQTCMRCENKYAVSLNQTHGGVHSTRHTVECTQPDTRGSALNQTHGGVLQRGVPAT
jgi:hypothetical protein